MDRETSQKLLEFAKHLDIEEENVLSLRQRPIEQSSIAALLRKQLGDGRLQQNKVTSLLVAAFNLSFADVQLSHMWLANAISDEEFDAYMCEKIAQESEKAN